MKKWDKEYLMGMAGSHIASEPHSRIQVLIAPEKEHDLWQIAHGELLLIAISGVCVVKTEHEECLLNPGEEAYFLQGEMFSLYSENKNTETLIQAIWTPGISGECSICKERYHQIKPHIFSA